MGYRLSVTPEPERGTWSLALFISLNRAESNDLFLSGDYMVAWPEEGLESSGETRLERTSMFISEVAARSSGLGIRYAQREQAERAKTLIKAQLASAGIEEEC